MSTLSTVSELGLEQVVRHSRPNQRQKLVSCVDVEARALLQFIYCTRPLRGTNGDYFSIERSDLLSKKKVRRKTPLRLRLMRRSRRLARVWTGRVSRFGEVSCRFLCHEEKGVALSPVSLVSTEYGIVIPHRTSFFAAVFYAYVDEDKAGQWSMGREGFSGTCMNQHLRLR